VIKAHKAYFQVLLLWIFLTTIIPSVGLLLALPFLSPFFNDDSQFASSLFLVLFIFGLLIGSAQWIAINSRLKTSWLWIPATAIGYPVGSFAIFLFSAIAVGLLLRLDQHYYKVSEYAREILTVGGAGMFTGTLQWLSLNRSLRTSFKWSLLSGLSTLLGFGALIHISNILILPQFVGLLIWGPVMGLVTGIFVEPLILRHR